MKKILALIMAMATAFSLSACGVKGSKADESVNTMDGVVDMTNPDGSAEMPQEISQETIKLFPTTDSNCFESEPDGNGGVYVTSCNSKDEVIVIPETLDGKIVTGVAANAFNGVTQETRYLEAVVLPDTVQEVGAFAFGWCHNLKYIDFGTGLKTIGEQAFQEDENLVSASFPEGMTEIQGTVFTRCAKLEKIYIPGTVTEIPNGIVDVETCPNAVVMAPSESAAFLDCEKYDVPHEAWDTLQELNAK